MAHDPKKKRDPSRRPWSPVFVAIPVVLVAGCLWMWSRTLHSAPRVDSSTGSNSDAQSSPVNLRNAAAVVESIAAQTHIQPQQIAPATRLDDLSASTEADEAFQRTVLERFQRLEDAVATVYEKVVSTAAAPSAPNVQTSAVNAAPAAGVEPQPPAKTTAAAAEQSALHAPAPSRRPLRNAVIGLANNIDFKLLYRFVRSLRQSAPASTTALVLFTDANVDGDADMRWLVSSYAVTIVPFNVASFPPSYRASHPSSYRWILIRDWMKEQAQKAASQQGQGQGQGRAPSTTSAPGYPPFDAVLFTDVRDTVFQADPFAHLERVDGDGEGEGEGETGAYAPSFYAFMEQRPGTIGGCGWNSGWVRDCFGDGGLARVAGEVISCSGTSMGTWEAAYSYADMVAREVDGNKCERNGVDQGMHNYFLHSGALQQRLDKDAAERVSQAGGTSSNKNVVASVKKIWNEEGWIATVQAMPTLHRDRGGRVVNSRGEVYAVVHQYDRSQALKDQYEREYVLLDQGERDKK